ncbi:MAG: CBS domain-containing protein [Chloroflexi bacterium]|nr:CBS domain-containing protein [Chloroflexota bacterium]
MQQEIVRTWMTPNPTTVSPTATLDEAHQLMKALHVRHLPVVADQRLIGLISKTDVYQAKLTVAASEAKEETAVSPSTVADVVSSSASLPHIAAHELVATAAQTMLQHHLTALPVLENGRLIGILTEADIFRMVIKSSG